MKKTIALILIVVLLGMFLVGCASEINSGTEDILYNDIVYERFTLSNYNLAFTEENATYIGDFLETYDYGRQLPWEVYALNGEENVLYSAHAVWIRPGYVFPSEFGEDFSSVDYVVTEGIDFLVIEDDYKEYVTKLATFDKSVKLEDILAAEPSDITEFTEFDSIRFKYKNHADMELFFTLCSSEDRYYLNVKEENTGESRLYEIKSEYTKLLTSAIPVAE